MQDHDSPAAATHAARLFGDSSNHPQWLIQALSMRWDDVKLMGGNVRLPGADFRQTRLVEWLATKTPPARRCRTDQYFIYLKLEGA